MKKKNLLHYWILTLLALLLLSNRLNAQAYDNYTLSNSSWTDLGKLTIQYPNETGPDANIADKDTTTKYTITHTSAWIQLETPVKVRMFALIIAPTHGSNTFDPKNFDFQVSTDGTTWTTQASYTNLVFGSRNPMVYLNRICRFKL